MAPTISQPQREPARPSLRDSSSFREHRLGVSVKSQGHSPFHAISGVRELDVDAQGRPRSWDGPVERPISWGVPEERPLSWDVPEERPISWDLPAGRPISWHVPAERPISWHVPAERPISWDVPEERPISWDLPTFARAVSHEDSTFARAVSHEDSTEFLKAESESTWADDTPPPPTSSPRGVDALWFSNMVINPCASAPASTTAGRVSISKTFKPLRTTSEQGALNYIKEQKFLMESARALARTPSRPVATEAGGKSPQLALFLSVESWGSSCHEGTARYGKCSPLRALKI